MSNYQLLSAEHFSDKRWQRYSSYQFAAQDVVVPITLHERVITKSGVQGV
jgi:hypothetical protein